MTLIDKVHLIDFTSAGGVRWESAVLNHRHVLEPTCQALKTQYTGGWRGGSHSSSMRALGGLSLCNKHTTQTHTHTGLGRQDRHRHCYHRNWRH